jgi:hypothetical protein
LRKRRRKELDVRHAGGAWLTLGLAVAALVAGCSQGPSDGGSLPGAVYASQVPLYPSATYEDAMGGTYSAGVGGPPVSESLSWFFKVSDPPEKVVAFYEGKLPGAERGVIRGADDADDPTFTVVPTGAEDGEYIRVIVGQGKLQITEVVKPGKRKRS